MSLNREAEPQIFEGEILAYKNQYLITHSINIESIHTAGGNGLVDIYTGSVRIITGLDDGEINLRLEFHSSEPPIQVGLWDEIVDFSFHADENFFLETLYGGGADHFPLINFRGAGDYRIRAYARGRDEASATLEPVEFHSLHVWLGAPKPILSHQHRDAKGEYWRDAVRRRGR
ncbi:hypothetical protein ACFY3V_23490 [Streptosporangium sp. NPDC000095]|uniref:hypothetical protein n=1 Tax=Streptosporangium sp. NPDC000095 TaxID=3366184 RepID=UPI0036AFAF98